MSILYFHMILFFCVFIIISISQITNFPNNPLHGAHQIQSFCLGHTEWELLLLISYLKHCVFGLFFMICTPFYRFQMIKFGSSSNNLTIPDIVSGIVSLASRFSHLSDIYLQVCLLPRLRSCSRIPSWPSSLRQWWFHGQWPLQPFRIQASNLSGFKHPVYFYL